MRNVPIPYSEAYAKFKSSMLIDYEKWHDGIGYDLDAFGAMTRAEQDEIVQELREKSPQDWRDVEVLGIAGTPESKAGLKQAAKIAPPQAKLRALEALKESGEL